MSPDERTFEDVVSRAIRRSRTLMVLEGVSWGAVGAAFYLPLGFLVSSLAIAWRLRRAPRRAVVGVIDRANPGCRNLIVTADELLRGQLTAKPDVRQRVFADAANAGRRIDVAVAIPVSGFVRAFVAASAAWLVVVSTGVWRSPITRVARQLLPAAVAGRSSTDAVHVTVTIEPPRYTGLASTTLVDPAEISSVQGSTLVVAIDARNTNRVTVDHDGRTRTVSPGADNRAIDRVELTRTGYYAIETEAGRRLIPLVALPDALPTVRLVRPGRDFVSADGNQRVTFDVRALDDFGLRSMSLQFTKVAGSGEEFEFRDGEIPLDVVTSGDRDWRGAAARSLAELGLKDGDMLVYRAVATDARPGAGTASSDAFFIEISRLAVGAGDGFTIPEEETRYALSQQMLVVKTDRLEKQRASIAAADFGEAALNLAVEQRMIRAEFVFMLGGEIEDEEVEAAQSTELQEGRLQNRGQRDLRQATVAMSLAEKLLTAGSTREALTAERDAIAALQRAFARDRYILRALAGQTRLDPARRLTGLLTQARDWRRARPVTIENRRAALLQDLLEGIGELRGDAAPQRIVVLAGQALRIDPDSTALRRVATDLQRIADSWPTLDGGKRQSALGAVLAAVGREASDALARPTPPATFVAPTLAGALTDAARGSSR